MFSINEEKSLKKKKKGQYANKGHSSKGNVPDVLPLTCALWFKILQIKNMGNRGRPRWRGEQNPSGSELLCPQPVIVMVDEQPAGFVREMKGYLRVKDGEDHPHPPIQAGNCEVGGSGGPLSLTSQ